MSLVQTVNVYKFELMFMKLILIITEIALRRQSS